jgi:hypothetical protein
MAAIEVPAIEVLLRTSAGLEGVAGFSFLDESFSLAALDALGKKGLTQCCDLRLSGVDAGSQQSGEPLGCPCLFQPGEPIGQLARLSARRNETAPGTLPFRRSGGGVFKAAEVGSRSLKRAFALFFLKRENA